MDEQLQPQPTAETQPQISSVALAHLKSAVPWMRLVAIVGFVMTGFLVLGGVAILVTMPLGFIGFIAYLIGGIISFFPQLFLLQYANRIQGYIRSNNAILLERAFERQKSFWMYLGILAIIYLAIIVLFLLVLAFAGAAIFPLLKHNPYMQQ
jgi:hypothetical protein